MTDTQLLNQIRKEMKKQGVLWKKEQELFELLIPNESWKKYKTSWSNWKHERVRDFTKSPHIRLAIQQKLFFESDIWGASSLIQKEAIQKGVYQAFIKKEDTLPDWTKIIPKFHLDEEQRNLLTAWEQLSPKVIEERVQNYPDYFKRTFSNQAFLLELLNIFYAKGAYDFLVENIFPNLLSHQRANLNVKVMEAHALGSLKEPKYMQSVKLLESIEPSNDKKLIDLKTSMLSNLRRYYTKEPLSLKELKYGMEVMVKMYHELFVYEEVYHYYPAINLVYILQVLNALSVEQHSINARDVYKKAKNSISQEKELIHADTLYYASVTELEFLLLLGEKGVCQKMGYMLESQTPAIALVQRTKRQMVEFVAMVERVGVRLPEFNKVIEVLNDYENL